MTQAAAYQFYRHRSQVEGAAILHRQAETLALRAETFGHADAVVIGDSILGSVSIECGRSFMIAVSAARAVEVLPSAQRVLAILKPQVAVIGIGTNDQRDFGRPADLSLLADWKGRIVWVLPNRSRGTASAMTRLAGQRGEIVYRFVGKTLDGTHPDQAGRAQLARELSAICQRELAAAKPS